MLLIGAEAGTMTFETFDRYVAERVDGLLRYAVMLSCDPDEAQDIVQEVLVRAQARWSRIEEMNHPHAYVKRMVVNEFLSLRRRARRVLPVSSDQFEQLMNGSGPVSEPAADVHGLAGRIAALPPRQRAVIVLRYFEDMSDDEIAAMLRCRAVTVRSHASRALATLRRALGSAGQPVDDGEIAAGEMA